MNVETHFSVQINSCEFILIIRKKWPSTQSYKLESDQFRFDYSTN